MFIFSDFHRLSSKNYVCSIRIENITRAATQNRNEVRWYMPGGVLPSKRLLGMCRWMGSHFHIWTDYNGVTFLACFSRVTRMGSQIFEIFGIRKFW